MSIIDWSFSVVGFILGFFMHYLIQSKYDVLACLNTLYAYIKTQDWQVNARILEYLLLSAQLSRFRAPPPFRCSKLSEQQNNSLTIIVRDVCKFSLFGKRLDILRSGIVDELVRGLHQQTKNKEEKDDL